MVGGRLFTGNGAVIIERNKTTGAQINSFPSAGNDTLGALAGAVPEPTSLTLLGLLAPAALRRRPPRRA